MNTHSKTAAKTINTHAPIKLIRNLNINQIKINTISWCSRAMPPLMLNEPKATSSQSGNKQTQTSDYRNFI